MQCERMDLNKFCFYRTSQNKLCNVYFSLYPVYGTWLTTCNSSELHCSPLDAGIFVSAFDSQSYLVSLRNKKFLQVSVLYPKVQHLFLPPSHCNEESVFTLTFFRPTVSSILRCILAILYFILNYKIIDK